jgi:hypothetical protein
MSTVNPHDFDSRMLKTQEEEMVDNIWTAISRYALFDSYFMNVLENMEEFDFLTVKEVLDGEIARLTYVPSHLRFEDRYGLLEKSKAMIDSSSRASIRRNSALQYR